MRLKTLVGLRWFAVIGQAITVFVVHYWFEFDLPLGACLSVIALSAWLNVAMRMHFAQRAAARPRPVAWLLAYDIAQLAVLIVLTGGIENPFAFLILAPVLDRRDLAAAALHAAARSVRRRVLDGDRVLLSGRCHGSSQQELVLPPLYIFAIWVANLVAIVFIGAYAWQVAEERPADGRRAHRDRTGARARAASLAARRARGRGGA